MRDYISITLNVTDHFCHDIHDLQQWQISLAVNLFLKSRAGFFEGTLTQLLRHCRGVI
jgi:hypothetical protein